MLRECGALSLRDELVGARRELAARCAAQARSWMLAGVGGGGA